MRYLTIFILLFSCHIGHSQLKTGVKGFYGRSIVLNDLVPIRPPQDTYPTAYDHNFGGGAYLQYGFNKWIGIETSLIFEQLNTYEGFFVQATEEWTNADQLEFDEDGLADWFSIEQWIRLNYLSVPLGVEFRLKRWKLGVGGQYSYLLKAGGAVHSIMVGFQDDYTPFSWAGDFYFHRRHNLTAYASVGFNVWDNLYLEAKICEGLIDISQELYGGRYWTRQFQFGLSYEIWPREKKENILDETPSTDVLEFETP